MAPFGRLMLLLLIPALAASARLSASADANGGIWIELDGRPWLVADEVQVAGLSKLNGSLSLLGVPGQREGTDQLGSYITIDMTWGRSDSNATLMTTSVRSYLSDPSTLVFEQQFPQQLGPDKAAATLSARSIFPGFRRPSVATQDRDCFAYHGVFPSINACMLSTYQESHQGGAPLVVYDSSNSSLPMTVFSALNYPKAQHMASDANFFGAGVKATVELIPAGWSQLFILTGASGINDGFMTWGERMLTFTGKPKADLYRDQTHSTIGFWTDNGGYYHYATGDPKIGANYEEVLQKVKAYHDSIQIPFGHWQFDSWFYPKDGGVSPGGGGGAVTNWTALPSVFPHGMAYIQEKLNLPTVMHNRQWSVISDYIHNESFKWYKSAKAAVPEDPAAFFDWFFQQQPGWGLSMYEQDWMCTEYDEVLALQTNITLADLWLQGMAQGAASSGRTIQYCMPYPNDVLASSAHGAVTNARATGDYFHAKDQWAIGGTSLFYWAIQLLPFKDGFYSSTNKQVGGQTVGPETNPDREALMATLSCAMVGPMDGIYLLNRTRIMSTCRHDGVVLKPDKPVTTTDMCFTKANPTCYIYHTYSAVPGLGKIHYLFNNQHEPLTPDMVYLQGSTARHLIYNWYTQEVSWLTKTNNLTAGYEGHIYAVVTPVVSGWALVGEIGKYVTASALRFKSSSVDAISNSLSVSIAGVAGETVKVCAVAVSNDIGPLSCQSVEFNADATKSLTFE